MTRKLFVIIEIKLRIPVKYVDAIYKNNGAKG
jgi:hypothetical protein